jgi:hypothetical protein
MLNAGIRTTYQYGAGVQQLSSACVHTAKYRRYRSRTLPAIRLSGNTPAPKAGPKDADNLVAYQKRRKLSGPSSAEENNSTSPDELLKILRRYLQESHETERTIASRIGVNRHTFSRWLSDSQSPKKRTLALAASFLRRAGYL